MANNRNKIYTGKGETPETAEFKINKIVTTIHENYKQSDGQIFKDGKDFLEQIAKLKQDGVQPIDVLVTVDMIATMKRTGRNYDPELLAEIKWIVTTPAAALLSQVEAAGDVSKVASPERPASPSPSSPPRPATTSPEVIPPLNLNKSEGAPKTTKPDSPPDTPPDSGRRRGPG